MVAFSAGVLLDSNFMFISSLVTNRLLRHQVFFRFWTLLMVSISARAGIAREVLGPSSRTTPIVISEIMYKPADRADGKNLEFIELYNSNPWFQDIGGYQLTCADMTYVFPSGTLISSNSFIVVAAVPADITSVYGITNVVGPYIGTLK